jgi:AcrR family transcriptional regulator
VAKAVELFSSSGYRETSLQEITSKLDITRPLFYYYFDSKEDLLWHIVGGLGDDLLKNARPIAAAASPPAEKLKHLVEAHVTTLLSNLDAFRIYFAERHLIQGEQDRRLERGERAYRKLVAAVIEEGQGLGELRPGDSQVLTRFLIGMANSITRWYADSGQAGVDEVSRLAGELAADSLR